MKMMIYMIKIFKIFGFKIGICRDSDSKTFVVKKKKNRPGNVKRFNRKIIQERGLICQRCFKEFQDASELQIHHIIPIYINKELRTSPENVLVLCKQCHTFIHAKVNL